MRTGRPPWATYETKTCQVCGTQVTRTARQWASRRTDRVTCGVACADTLGRKPKGARAVNGRENLGAKPRLFVSVGQVFGDLTVVETGHYVQAGRPAGHPGLRAALCQCVCGNRAVVALTHLRSGNKKSCGCRKDRLSRERMIERDRQVGKDIHGLSKHPNYKRWLDMLGRCENPAHPSYPGYGARGITVCSEWHDVRAFIADLDRGLPVVPPVAGIVTASLPPKGYSMDRVDNDGPYSFDNVRWANAKTQQGNTRRGKTPLAPPP